MCTRHTPKIKYVNISYTKNPRSTVLKVILIICIGTLSCMRVNPCVCTCHMRTVHCTSAISHMRISVLSTTSRVRTKTSENSHNYQHHKSRQNPYDNNTSHTTNSYKLHQNPRINITSHMKIHVCMTTTSYVRTLV